MKSESRFLRHSWVYFLVIGFAVGIVFAYLIEGGMRPLLLAIFEKPLFQLGSLADWSAAILTAGAIAFGAWQFRRQITLTREISDKEIALQKKVDLQRAQIAAVPALKALEGTHDEIMNALDALEPRMTLGPELTTVEINIAFDKIFAALPPLETISAVPEALKRPVFSLRRSVRSAQQEARNWLNDGHHKSATPSWWQTTFKLLDEVKDLKNAFDDFVIDGKPPATSGPLKEVKSPKIAR